MRLLPTTFLALALAAPAAAAADNLARLEAATELGGQQLNSFLLSRAPELEPNLPNWEWDEPYRATGSCFLDTLVGSQGAAFVERYLSVLETYAATPVTSLAQTENQPPEMMAQPVLAAMQTCGVQQQVMQRMTQSGLMGAMMNEAMMQKLGG